MKVHAAGTTRLLSIVGLLALTMLAPSAASAGNPCFHGFEMPTPTTEETTQVKLMPCAFAPTVAVVEPGATVEFFNGPEFAHLITGANQLWGSPEVEVKPNTVLSYTFETPGVYPYACALHIGMSGAIVVGDAAAGAGAGPVAAGQGNPEPGPVATATETVDEAAVRAAEAAAAASVASAEDAQSASASVPLGFVVLGGAFLAAIAAGLAWTAMRRRPTTPRPLIRAE